MRFNRNYYVKDYLFQEVREVVKRDPFLWHSRVGIDTERIAGGQWTPSFITGEGDDCLRAAVSFQTTGGVWDHHKKCTYTAVNAYIAKGLAQNRVEAANMILELYGAVVVVKEARAIFRRPSIRMRFDLPEKMIVRTEYSDGSVECEEYKYKIKRYRDGNFKSGSYVPSGKEIVAPYPLNYPELLIRQETIYIVETEAECQALTTFDFLTTAARGGEISTLNWSQFIRKREVVLMPARDKAGYEFATRVADSLSRVGCTIKLVALPSIRHGENITHWIKRGGQQDVLWQIVKNTPVWNGLLFSYQSVSEQSERQSR